MNEREQPLALALVTGAAQGIGAALVERLLQDGLRVIALDQSGGNLAKLADKFAGLPLAIRTFDLTDIQATPDLLQELLAEHGPITRLALNAGVWPGAPIVEMTDEIWDLNFFLNVTSPFVSMRTLVPAMRAAGGGAILASPTPRTPKGCPGLGTSTIIVSIIGRSSAVGMR